MTNKLNYLGALYFGNLKDGWSGGALFSPRPRINNFLRAASSDEISVLCDALDGF